MTTTTKTWKKLPEPKSNASKHILCSDWLTWNIDAEPSTKHIEAFCRVNDTCPVGAIMWHMVVRKDIIKMDIWPWAKHL